MFMTHGPARAGAEVRATSIVALLVLLSYSLSACSGGGGGGEAQAAASCDSIRQIQSYRYTINLKLQSPAFKTANSMATPAPPLGVFADPLEALFSDLKLEGAYRAPDRTQAVLRFRGEVLELREVGGKSWIAVGSSWREQEPGKEETALTPGVVCKDIVDEITPSLADADSEREMVNGVDADHYKLNEADLKRLPELLGTNGEAGLPEEYQIDVWLAREGRFPVRLQLGAEDKDEQGNPISLSLFMEFRDLNDPGIQIEPPVLPSAGS
jgi:hypothetical protein